MSTQKIQDENEGQWAMVAPFLENHLSSTYPKSRLIGSDDSSSSSNAHSTDTAEVCYLYVTILNGVYNEKKITIQSQKRKLFCSNYLKDFSVFSLSQHLCEAGHLEWILSCVMSREKLKKIDSWLFNALISYLLFLELRLHWVCFHKHYVFLWNHIVPI